MSATVSLSPTVTAGMTLDHSESARANLKKMPAHCAAISEAVERGELRAKVLQEARLRQIEERRAARDDLQSRKSHFERSLGPKITDEHLAAIAEFDARIAEERRAIKKLQAQKMPSCLSVARRNLWLARINPRRCRAKLVKIDAKDAAEVVRREREAFLYFKDQISEVEAAPLSLAEALAKADAEISKLAARGAPYVRSLFRLRKGLARDDVRQGSISWPRTEVLGTGLDRALSDGTALLAWVFESELKTKVAALIEQAAPEESISRKARPARIAELRQKILDAEYRECAAITVLEQSGDMSMFRRHDADLRAVFGIELGNTPEEEPEHDFG